MVCCMHQMVSMVSWWWAYYPYEIPPPAYAVPGEEAWVPTWGRVALIQAGLPYDFAVDAVGRLLAQGIQSGDEYDFVDEHGGAWIV